MNCTARLYSCTRCHSQVVICRHCDRGNIYCEACAPLAHDESKRRAAKRYQSSTRGRTLHAARQRRYRESFSRKKVTHKGSIAGQIRALLRHKSEMKKLRVIPPLTKRNSKIRCHVCTKLCSDFLRLDFLRRRVSLVISTA